VNWIATSGATFYITGVQLEKGSTATSFDYRPYGTELALCQRYYIKLANSGDNSRYSVTNSSVNSTRSQALALPVLMRAVPTASVITQPNIRFVRTTADGSGGDVGYTTLSAVSSTEYDYTITANVSLSNAGQLLSFNHVLGFNAEL
jgi:hypothetical protein